MRQARAVKMPRVGSARCVFCVALVVGCGNDIDSRFGLEEVTEPIDALQDAGTDAGGCPENEPDEIGAIMTRRGCPLTIEYAIK